MSQAFKLTILTPERRLAEGVEVEEVTLPGSEGQIQLLPGHAPALGTLETGVFSYKALGNASPVHGVISSGFFNVGDDGVVVTAQTLELGDEIDVVRAKAAQKKAEETLQASHLDDHQFKKYQLKLERAIIRQQVGSG